MFAKLAVLILSIGVVACVLLTVRQLRLQAVHEMAEVQRRVAERDRTLWRLRVEIASRLTPDRVEQMVQALGPLESIDLDTDAVEVAAGRAQPSAWHGPQATPREGHPR